jgi:hypothetical protein
MKPNKLWYLRVKNQHPYIDTYIAVFVGLVFGTTILYFKYFSQPTPPALLKQGTTNPDSVFNPNGSNLEEGLNDLSSVLGKIGFKNDSGVDVTVPDSKVKSFQMWQLSDSIDISVILTSNASRERFFDKVRNSTNQTINLAEYYLVYIDKGRQMKWKDETLTFQWGSGLWLVPTKTMATGKLNSVLPRMWIDGNYIISRRYDGINSRGFSLAPSISAPPIVNGISEREKGIAPAAEAPKLLPVPKSPMPPTVDSRPETNSKSKPVAQQEPPRRKSSSSVEPKTLDGKAPDGK